MKWSEAQFSCEQQEAELVTIANPLEQGREAYGESRWCPPEQSPHNWLEQGKQGPTPSLLPFFWGEL